MRRLFILICGLLLYGSFYPWTFSPGGSFWAAALHVFSAWPYEYSFAILKDMALNIVVYAPLGLTGYLSLAPGFRWKRAVAPVVFGFFLSWFVETMQAFLPRQPSGMDLLCNTLGTAAGVAIAAAYESALAKWFARLNRSTLRPSSALMMLIIFVAHYSMPLATNTIKLFTTWHHPVIDQHWDWTEFANTLAGWLFAGRFVEAVAGSKHRQWASRALLAALVAAACTRLISPNLLFTWSMLAGAVAGVGIWKSIEGRGPEKLYATFALLWLAGDGLRPYRFTDHKSFDWIPFLVLLHNDWTFGVTSLLLKSQMYGTAFWTWERAGLSRPRALVALLALLACIEYAQTYLPDRLSGMTDLVMGAIAAGLLWSVERKYGT